MKRIVLCACEAAASLILAGTAWGHNTDTSYVRVRLASNQVELRLTCDLYTLSKITELDADGDQRITQEEFRDAVPAIEKFLRGAVVFEVNGQPLDLGTLAKPDWPKENVIPEKEWHATQGLISFDFEQRTAPAREVGLGFDLWARLGPNHTVLGVFEWRGRGQEIIFTRHSPDYLYRVDDGAPESPSVSNTQGQQTTLGQSLWRFLRLGVEHIFLGYDHICFLLALIVVSRFRELLKIITSFTVAHSITLILATLDIVRLPSRLIECGIALTIVYVAAENLWTQKATHRWRLTFFFGLIHGFGFANVLAELGLPRSGTVRCLLAFNVGVELGQLAVVIALLPLTFALGKWRHGRRAALALSVVAGLFGAGWFIDRVFNLGFMPL